MYYHGSFIKQKNFKIQLFSNITMFSNQLNLYTDQRYPMWALSMHVYRQPFTYWSIDPVTNTGISQKTKVSSTPETSGGYQINAMCLLISGHYSLVNR